MTNKSTQAIDMHGHFGLYNRLSLTDLENKFMTCNATEVVDRACKSNTSYTIVSPITAFFPFANAEVIKANEEAASVVAETDQLLQWVVVNPLQKETFEQARHMLNGPKCAGIKIHPEEHNYYIREYGREIFEFAAEHNVLILTHSGDTHSLPSDFLSFANEFSAVPLILAHLGNGGDAAGNVDLQTHAIQASKHGNVYTDTSSMRSILPNIIEWAVGQIGADRIVYGTDTPLYFAPSFRARIDNAYINDTEKKMILRENALKLLKGRVRLEDSL